MRQQSTARIFSQVSQEQAKYRANYPVVAIDKILKGLGNPCHLIAVDMGAGTGIASRQLAERGVRVLAIEPDSTMIQDATPHPLVEFRQTAAEAKQLPDSSADVVTCFTAFHWFDFERGLQECQRILKPLGQLALVWNHWSSADPFTRRYTCLIRKAAKQYRTKVTPYSDFPSGYVKLLRILLLWQLCWIPHFLNVHQYKFQGKSVSIRLDTREQKNLKYCQ